MSRIELTAPAHVHFRTRLQIYVGHINESGHLDNAQLLTLVSEARQRFFQHLGFTQTSVGDLGIILADTAVQYRSEAFQGETLEFAVTAHDFNRYGCDLFYTIHALDEHGHPAREVARVKNGIVFFDYRHTRKIASLPEIFRQALERLEAQSDN